LTDHEIIMSWRRSSRDFKAVIILSQLSNRKITEVLQLLCASCDMSRGWRNSNVRPQKIGGINNGKDKGQVVRACRHSD
jgi:hypothetical protein